MQWSVGSFPMMHVESARSHNKTCFLPISVLHVLQTSPHSCFFHCFELCGVVCVLLPRKRSTENFYRCIKSESEVKELLHAYVMLKASSFRSKVWVILDVCPPSGTDTRVLLHTTCMISLPVFSPTPDGFPETTIRI